MTRINDHSRDRSFFWNTSGASPTIRTAHPSPYHMANQLSVDPYIRTRGHSYPIYPATDDDDTFFLQPFNGDYSLFFEYHRIPKEINHRRMAPANCRHLKGRYIGEDLQCCGLWIVFVVNFILLFFNHGLTSF